MLRDLIMVAIGFGAVTLAVLSGVLQLRDITLRCCIFGHRWRELFDEPGYYCWRCGAIKGTKGTGDKSA